jgi:hypothetical protein
LQEIRDELIRQHTNACIEHLWQLESPAYQSTLVYNNVRCQRFNMKRSEFRKHTERKSKASAVLHKPLEVNDSDSKYRSERLLHSTTKNTRRISKKYHGSPPYSPQSRHSRFRSRTAITRSCREAGARPHTGMRFNTFVI